MHKIKIWVEFNDVASIGAISNKANIKLTIEGDMKKVDIVSQLDLKSGYEFEYELPGEYCLSLESENINYKENVFINMSITDIEIEIE